MSSDTGKKSCRKGKSGEQEFCRRMATLTNGRVNLQRNLTQCRDSGDDTGVFDFSIEIKRWQKVSDALVRDWWCQCQRNAANKQKIPVLAFRADHQAWQIVMHPGDFFEQNDVRGCLRMDIELFCKYLLHPNGIFEKANHGTPA